MVVEVVLEAWVPSFLVLAEVAAQLPPSAGDVEGQDAGFAARYELADQSGRDVADIDDHGDGRIHLHTAKADPQVARDRGYGATMSTPPFITELRSLIGHRPLWLSCAVAVVLDDEGRVLLGRRADNGAWTLPGGIIDPAEQPADAAVRECFEETGVLAVPEALTSVTVSRPITYANGDQVQYLELAFRCRAVGGQARVNDGECLEVRWYALEALPELGDDNLRWLNHALDGRNEAAYTFSGLAEVLESPS